MLEGSSRVHGSAAYCLAQGNTLHNNCLGQKVMLPEWPKGWWKCSFLNTHWSFWFPWSLDKTLMSRHLRRKLVYRVTAIGAESTAQPSLRAIGGKGMSHQVALQAFDSFWGLNTGCDWTELSLDQSLMPDLWQRACDWSRGNFETTSAPTAGVLWRTRGLVLSRETPHSWLGMGDVFLWMPISQGDRNPCRQLSCLLGTEMGYQPTQDQCKKAQISTFAIL